MITLLTSISPSHTNSQTDAVMSWLNNGLKVISMNHESEIIELKTLYPGVEFVPTYRTMEKTFGKKYVNVNALLDHAKALKEDHFCIINSDIQIIDNSGELNNVKDRMSDGVLFARRLDFDNDPKINKRFDLGLDVFFIHKKFFKIT